jgi:hypothetical protein
MTAGNKAKWITRTALLLALTIVFQSIRVFVPTLSLVNLGIMDLSTLVIGSLVNLALLASARFVGPLSGVIISVVAPIIAFSQGHVPIVYMIAPIAIGNLVLVLVYYYGSKGMPEAVALMAAAVVKFAALFVMVRYIVIPLFVKADKLKAALSAGFSWPQLITAVVAGVITLIIFPALKRAVKDR